jgi:hypothetical protein
MGKLTQVERLEANSRAILAPAVAEHEQFHACAVCSKRVDRRNLADVLHHEQQTH